MTNMPQVDLLHLTTDIVASYVAGNNLPVSDIPALIERVYKTLSQVAGGSQSMPERPQPAVPIKKSVTPEFIICLEDGKKMKMLKRHLKTSYNMTPDQYRERWGLGADYPMVAPNYAEKRSSLAKNIGLGKKRASGRRGAK